MDKIGRHKHSILVCVMDDGTSNTYINGIHCYSGMIEIQSPERLKDRVGRKDVVDELRATADIVDKALTREQLKEKDERS